MSIPNNPSTADDADTFEALARRLESHPDYRVLRRFVSRDRYGEPTGQSLAKGIVVDTETTGLSQVTDKIVELGLVAFEYDPQTGQAFRVLGRYGSLEDPGRPIPQEATALHGITDEMVRGKRIDDVAVHTLVQGTNLVIAHNARFDRPFVEARLPAFVELPWACSLMEIDWSAAGIGSAKLDYIAYRCGIFHGAHRAENDCAVLLEVLQRPVLEGQRLPLLDLIEASRIRSYRVLALNSPFDAKDLLKARDYWWEANDRVWHRTVRGDDALRTEVAWLKATIYGGRSVRLTVEAQDAKVRYSARRGKVVTKEV